MYSQGHCESGWRSLSGLGGWWEPRAAGGEAPSSEVRGETIFVAPIPRHVVYTVPMNMHEDLLYGFFLP